MPAEVVDKVALREVVHGLDASGRWSRRAGTRASGCFIVEQHAARSASSRTASCCRQPFFTIDGLSDGNEQGLLGLAFHPEFARTASSTSTTRRRTWRRTSSSTSATNPDRVDPKTARELIRIEQPYSNHNGGNLVFGPDGKLYTGMGDGGAANDPHGNGQNPKALLGEDPALRRRRRDADARRSCTSACATRGGSAFDATTGDLYIGDVGQNLWE